eukprot:7426223-Pyramimonas_sp.AAC.1
MRASAWGGPRTQPFYHSQRVLTQPQSAVKILHGLGLGEPAVPPQRAAYAQAATVLSGGQAWLYGAFGNLITLTNFRS